MANVHFIKWLCVLIVTLVTVSAALAQPQDAMPSEDKVESLSPDVGVRSVATDNEIDERLTGILDATGWFENAEVSVRNGVVFLDGETTDEARKAWAGELARKTEDVAAVVNRIQVVASVWNIAPAKAELERIWQSAIQAVPIVLFAAVVLPITWLLAGLVSRLAER